MATIQHKIITGSDLHVPGYKTGSDPGAVGKGIEWLDTSGVLIIHRSRNTANSAWDRVDAVTASFAETASFAQIAQTVLGTITSASFATTASFASNVLGSGVNGNVASATTATTASFANDVLKSTGGFQVTGTLRITSDVFLVAASSRIIPGTTNFAVRNNANNANNLLLTDAGAATFRSTVGGVTTLTATTEVAAPVLSGTLSAVGQPNVTSVGTLTSLTVGGTITLTPGNSRIVPGATDFAVRNNANNANNLLVSDAGVVTIRSDLILLTGASRIIPGGTSLALRNAANNADNLLIADAGAATFRAAVGGITQLSVSGNLSFSGASRKLVPGSTEFLIRNEADNASNIAITDAGAITFRSTVGGISTLTATTLAGTLSTAAQPNVTSLGTLTALTMGGTLTVGSNTLALAGATVSGTPVWSSNQAITLSTAAQPNVTSLGTLTGLAVSADASITGSLRFSGASRKIVPGTTNFSIRNTADSADNLLIADAGAITVRSTISGVTTLTATTLAGTLSTVAQGNVTSLGTLTALTIGGDLTFSGASRRIIPSTTNFSIRNNANSADNILIADTGSVGTRAYNEANAQVTMSLLDPTGVKPHGTIWIKHAV